MQRFFNENEEWLPEAHRLQDKLMEYFRNLLESYPDHSVRELLYLVELSASNECHSELIRRRLAATNPQT